MVTGRFSGQQAMRSTRRLRPVKGEKHRAGGITSLIPISGSTPKYKGKHRKGFFRSLFS